MELRIAGWQSHGLRCPDLRVHLTDSVNKKGAVSIIQMPNGTGKTTTLELLRASLTGAARDWPSSKVLEFRPSDPTDEGNFRLDLLVDGRPLVFEMSFDFTAGRILYSTTSPAIGGHRQGWEPPADIRRFLNPDFVDLIVFDGEFASDILNPAKTNAEHAVDAMSQLYLLDRARHLAEEEKERATRQSGVKGNRQALDSVRTKLDEVVERLAKVKKARRQIAAQLIEGEEQERKLQISFDEEAKKRAGNDELLETAKTKVSQSKQELVDLARNSFDAIRVPTLLDASFLRDLVELKRGFDSVKLPSSTSRQFFSELAEQELCVCGRPIDAEARKAIAHEADRFLGQEQAGVLNAIKTQIDAAIKDPESEDRVSALALSERLARAIDTFYLARTDLDEIVENLAAPGGDLAKLRQQLLDVGQENEKRRGALEQIDRQPDASDKVDTMCLAALQQQKNQLEKKLELLTDTVELGERTRIVTELLTRAKEKTRIAIRKQLVTQGNTLLRSILRQSPIEIEGMDANVRLKAQSDASVGQKLAVGYVMLGGLLHRGAHSLPFVVDSPANPIDHTVRREIAKLLPKLCDQFITFVISSEKQAFTSVLGETAASAQYITIYRKLDATTGYSRRLPKSGVSTSERFVLVENKEFFDTFDMDDE